jgi:hypothetical protein
LIAGQINHCSSFPSKAIGALLASRHGSDRRSVSATLECEINRSRARGLRNQGFYGLSRDQIGFCEEEE